MDPSRILNVPADADKETITKAYRKMALKYHPDRAGDHSKLKFQHVGAAYEILMAKPGGKETESDPDKYAGMSDEDVAWINVVRSQQEKEDAESKFSSKREENPGTSQFSGKQEKEYGSSKFSSESGSSFTEGAAGFVKDCPICNGPCNVEEFVAPPPSDPLDFTSWPAPAPPPFCSPSTQHKPKAYPPPTSGLCRPAAERPKAAQTSSAQFPMSSRTQADNVSHFLLRFRDHYSHDFFYTDSKVSVLWSYMPRDMDEFALQRGDMLRILSISDDGWAIGYRLNERADEWIGMTASEPIFPTWMDPSSVVKAFPLICVTVPWAWKQCVKPDLKARRGWNVDGARAFAPAYKMSKI